MRIQRRNIGEHLIKDGDHGLGIVAARDFFKNVAGHEQNLTAPRGGLLGDTDQHRMLGGFGAEHKDARRKTQINRLSGDLQTLGQKLSRFFTGFALMQSARNLHRRIG